MSTPTVALAGNPNSGKTSLFNLLTGSNLRVGNFPGITVEGFSGTLVLEDVGEIKLVDLPGAYSLFPNSADERITTEVLIDPNHEDHPELVVYVADANHLDRQLLALSQILDLGIPTVLVLSLIDEFEQRGNVVHTDQLEKKLGIKVLTISSRKNKNIAELKDLIIESLRVRWKPIKKINQLHSDAIKMLADIGQVETVTNIYQRWMWAHHYEWLGCSTGLSAEAWCEKLQRHRFEPLKEQVEETFARLNKLESLAYNVISKKPSHQSKTEKLDAVLTHWVLGPLIFFVIMLLVFQAIFAWATYPMDLIEAGFGALGNAAAEVLPGNWFGDLITEGVIPGLSGVLIFIPQIAILFFLVSILEEIGYMARAVYLFDRFLQRFGMNGRSVVALISGGACAIPAVMSTRTIVNWKERLITILVTPFISCSARIPVYTVLIAFVVPYESILGIFNSQGLAFAGLYILGIVSALLAGWVFKKILKSKMTSFLVMELPSYRSPDWRSVWRNIKIKVGAFIVEAGKVILLISIVLWFLASYGLPGSMDEAEAAARIEAQASNASTEATQDLIAARRLEASFAGKLGKLIEPAIQPLGYDWKIGIAVLTSFAAREVFVGSMATIYSIGSEENEFRIREHLSKQRDPNTGALIFDYATALSLLLFFVFAMQCMSTLAVVKKETRSWKWPLIQLSFMTVVAYVVSLLAYQLSI